MNFRGAAGPSGFSASRGSDEDGSTFDIAIEPEPIVCPDAGDRRSAPGYPAGSEHSGAWKMICIAGWTA